MKYAFFSRVEMALASAMALGLGAALGLTTLVLESTFGEVGDMVST